MFRIKNPVIVCLLSMFIIIMLISVIVPSSLEKMTLRNESLVLPILNSYASIKNPKDEDAKKAIKSIDDLKLSSHNPISIAINDGAQKKVPLTTVMSGILNLNANKV